MQIIMNVMHAVLPVLVESLQANGILESAKQKPKSTKPRKKTDAPPPAAA